MWFRICQTRPGDQVCSEPRSHMIIDIVVLTLTRVVHDPRKKLQGVILPEMRITTSSSIQVKKPVSRYELMLTGTVDYAGVAV